MPNVPFRLVLSIFGLLALADDLAPPSFAATSPGPGSGTLGDLFLPRGGRIVQYSSRAAAPGAIDAWEVPPGQTLTLLEHRGSGIVRRWWMTLLQHQGSPELFRRTILRCYWDGETSPSVESPLSDFFGLGFGEWHDYVSLPLSATAGGFNCYWPMPFHSSARITVENVAATPITGLYFNIEVETLPSVPKEALYFHAQFRRATPATRGEPVTVLETSGSGQYVGTVLSARTLRGAGMRFLEGDEEFFVDGEASPSVGGTGTEDYFSSGLYFVTGAFAAPYHGVTVLDPQRGRVAAYRWHIEDAIPFKKSLRFTLQHGETNDAVADYATLAIWYQTHPHQKFPSIPDALGAVDPLPPFRIENLVEGEDLVATSYASGGSARVQPTAEFAGDWSNDAQLLWVGGKPGSHLTLILNAPRAGAYALTGYFTRSRDYGNVRITLAGRELGIVHGYDAHGGPTGALPLGRVELQEGANYLLLEVTGKDTESTGYAFGVDGFHLAP